MAAIYRQKAENFEKEIFKYHNDASGWTKMKDHVSEITELLNFGKLLLCSVSIVLHIWLTKC